MRDDDAWGVDVARLDVDSGGPLEQSRAAFAAAPHVQAAITATCGGDRIAAAQLLAVLTDEQRHGLRVLPWALPLVPAVTSCALATMPEGVDHEALLESALCGEGPIDVLCAIARCDLEHITADPLAQVVEFIPGRFRFADHALRMYAIGSASEPERLAAHQRLSAILDAAGDEEGARWHEARGAVIGDPDLVAPLLDQADAALQGGDAVTAYARAAEAVEHATPGTSAQGAAVLAAARSALAGGWVADALERTEPLLAAGIGDRAEATGVYLLAHTLRNGAVRRGVGGRAAPDVGSWIPSVALCAERVAGVDADILSVEDEDRRIAHALRAGLDGDSGAGLRALAAPDAIAEDTALGLPAQVPLLLARRAVTEVLLHVWGGRIRVARDRLGTAAEELPVALPFAGLAVALARRLDLAVNGRIGSLAHQLTATLPWPEDANGFVDRAIDAYLHGRTDEAAVHVGLWTDCGAPTGPFALPGLDEIGPLEPPSAPEPPDATIGRTLRGRIRAARESTWRADLRDVAEESRAISSPFERARVEALLGSACATRGDRARAVRHLRAAQSLFEESGASAWQHMVDRRLRRLGGHGPPERPLIAVDADGGSGMRSPAPLEVCRVTWEPILTMRELDVALLMAEGRKNREIAQALHVSVRTVEVHAGKIFLKLDVRTRNELTVLAHRIDRHL